MKASHITKLISGVLSFAGVVVGVVSSMLEDKENKSNNQ